MDITAHAQAAIFRLTIEVESLRAENEQLRQELTELRSDYVNGSRKREAVEAAS